MTEMSLLVVKRPKLKDARDTMTTTKSVSLVRRDHLLNTPSSHLQHSMYWAFMIVNGFPVDGVRTKYRRIYVLHCDRIIAQGGIGMMIKRRTKRKLLVVAAVISVLFVLAALQANAGLRFGGGFWSSWIPW
jgi:hypothetical protein